MVSEVTQGQIVAIDGKTLRRFHDSKAGKPAIHMVNAWASANRLVLSQVHVDDKSNEITAIPKLLAMLEVTGCIVTIDAMDCQSCAGAAYSPEGQAHARLPTCPVYHLQLSRFHLLTFHATSGQLRPIPSMDSGLRRQLQIPGRVGRWLAVQR